MVLLLAEDHVHLGGEPEGSFFCPKQITGGPTPFTGNAGPPAAVQGGSQAQYFSGEETREPNY